MTVAPERPALPDDSSDGQEGHPAWCLPGFCETITHPGGTETRHLGAPLVWSMAGDDVDVVMRRQQVADGDGLGAATVEVHLAHRAFDEAVTLIFAAADARKLATGVLDLLDG